MPEFTNAQMEVDNFDNSFYSSEQDPIPDEWLVIDQVLSYLADFNVQEGDNPEEVLPLLDALRRATAIVQGRPQMVALAEQERRDLSLQVRAALNEFQGKSQELEQLRYQNKVLQGEAESGRTALDEALRRQESLQQELQKARAELSSVQKQIDAVRNDNDGFAENGLASNTSG
eukprot:TRINITY_DN55347_c0_g1_i1.p1 TRINITY_DN55347_c0_g1~~TRINITY_DN55347_c0_g1_i1.p1  ORF type:complete len:174 (+),score=51.42 TRINITY_DN55347_c0_g1_i1:50-571(+)